MRRYVTYVVAILFGVAALQPILHDGVHAQSASQAVTVSPASTEFSIDPGASVTKNIEIFNTGTESYTVQLSTAPYSVSGLQYDPRFTQLPGTLSVAEWITLESPSLELEADKTARVEYTVSVPESTPAGGYYAVIFAEVAHESADAGGIVPKKRVGSLVYITVNGDVKESGSLTGVPLDFFSFSKTVPLAVRVANDGGIHFSSAATFSVKNLFGKEVYETTVERTILPTTEREITTDFVATPSAGIYTVRSEAVVAGELVQLDDQKIVVVTPWFLLFLGAFLSSTAALVFLRVKRRKQTEDE